MRQISEEEFDHAFNRAPQVIQETINNGEWVPVITEIGHTYDLHIDQIGSIANLNTKMLLGLVSPTQFLGELLADGVPEADARKIMGEINEKIFKPLQAEMRKGAAPAVPGHVSRPVPPPAPRSAPPPPAQPRPVPPVPQARPMGAQPSITLPPRPTDVPRPVAAPMPQPVPPPPPAPPAPPQAASVRDWTLPQQAGAPLPPRTMMPGTAAPRFMQPLPPRGGMGQGVERQTSAASTQPVPPANLPTHTPPEPELSAADQDMAPPPPPIEYRARGESVPPTPHADPWAPQGTPGSEFPPLPPLAKPPRAPQEAPLPPETSNVPDGATPHTRYPGDPYREPLE